MAVSCAPVGWASCATGLVCGATSPWAGGVGAAAASGGALAGGAAAVGAGSCGRAGHYLGRGTARVGRAGQRYRATVAPLPVRSGGVRLVAGRALLVGAWANGLTDEHSPEPGRARSASIARSSDGQARRREDCMEVRVHV